RIGCGGRAVQYVIDITRGDTVVAAYLRYSLGDRARRIVGGCRDFVDGNMAAVQVAIHNVSEGAADINADRLHDVRSFCLFETEAGAPLARAHPPLVFLGPPGE